jgi:hypothetical protein
MRHGFKCSFIFFHHLFSQYSGIGLVPRVLFVTLSTLFHTARHSLQFDRHTGTSFHAQPASPASDNHTDKSGQEQIINPACPA